MRPTSLVGCKKWLDVELVLDHVDSNDDSVETLLELDTEDTEEFVDLVEFVRVYFEVRDSIETGLGITRLEFSGELRTLVSILVAVILLFQVNWCFVFCVCDSSLHRV
mmetsp:Transcript_122/g.292  ORF Transcript_122/g.292 Transcript_122/m.292 type:complete len:108 (-) Transcript_122:445-768(-)